MLSDDDISVAVVGGSTTAGAYTTPDKRWPELFGERVRRLMQPVWPRGKRFTVVNGGQGNTQTLRPTTYLSQLFSSKQDLVLWEFALNDHGHWRGERLIDIHHAFARRVFHAFPHATLGWVYIWDFLNRTTGQPVRNVEQDTETWRANLSLTVPSFTVSLAEVVNDHPNYNAEILSPDFAHLSVLSQGLLADLMVYAVIRCVSDALSVSATAAARAPGAAGGRQQPESQGIVSKSGTSNQAFP
jgi:hypothetical protein